MDRQDQAIDGKFEGGIFSGAAGIRAEEKQENRDPQENRYFDNASDYMQGTGIPLKELPAGGEGKGCEEAEFQEKAKRPEEPEFHGEPEYSEEMELGGGTKHPKESITYGESEFLRERKAAGEPQERVNSYRRSRSECGSCRCKNCPDRQKQGQTVLFIISVVAVAALTISLLAAVFGLVVVSLWKSGQSSGNAGNNTGNEKETYLETDPSKGAGLPNGDKYGKIPAPGAAGGGEYYGEIEDAIRTDLDYSIRWENYEYEGNNDDVTIAVDYPVIEGDIPNLEAINDIIDDETEYFEEYYKEYSKYMMPEESFLVYSEGYVTFMDPEIMSVVFCEMIYTDYWVEYGLYCLNIDVENGVVLDNNSIMNIDDEFAVDFRKRCRQQNGTVNDLDSMTDQEIVYYLTSGGTSILFYTPLGMEVGLNLGEYYVTVTYRDYEEFLQKY